MCLCTWDLKSTVKAACVYGDLSKRCRKLRRTGQVARRIETRNITISVECCDFIHFAYDCITLACNVWYRAIMKRVHLRLYQEK